jgi:hypothetical protein
LHVPAACTTLAFLAKGCRQQFFLQRVAANHYSPKVRVKGFGVRFSRCRAMTERLVNIQLVGIP